MLTSIGFGNIRKRINMDNLDKKCIGLCRNIKTNVELISACIETGKIPNSNMSRILKMLNRSNSIIEKILKGA